jgi:hypothetical protein
VSVKLQKRGFSKQLNVAFVINIILLSLVSSAFIAYVTHLNDSEKMAGSYRVGYPTALLLLRVSSARHLFTRLL